MMMASMNNQLKFHDHSDEIPFGQAALAEFAGDGFCLRRDGLRERKERALVRRGCAVVMTRRLGASEAAFGHVALLHDGG